MRGLLITLAASGALVALVYLLLYPLLVTWRHERQRNHMLARLHGRQPRFTSPWLTIAAATAIVTGIGVATGNLQLAYRLALIGLVVVTALETARYVWPRI